MTIQDINCFLKLAETLNFTKTAEALFISQPAVTRHINSLEEELGFSLLDRSIRRKVVLTESGRLYYNGLLKCSDIYRTTLEKILDQACNTPLLVNMMRGIRFPDHFVTATEEFMSSNPSFRHFMNFIDPQKIEQVLTNGELLICQKDYIPSLHKYKTMKLTATPIPHCIIASRTHSALADTAHPDFAALRQTTLFLPKDIPDSLKETYFSHLDSLMGGLPEEIMYLDSMDSVILFLRSGRCFTLGTQWLAETHSVELKTIPLSISADFYGVWDPSAMENMYYERYLKALRDSAAAPAFS